MNHQVVPIVDVNWFANSSVAEETELEGRLPVFMESGQAHLGSLVDVQEATAARTQGVVMKCRGLLHQQAAPHFEAKATLEPTAWPSKKLLCVVKGG